MLINRITVGEVKVPLKVPFKTALRTVNEVHDLVLMIETDSGLVGYGTCRRDGGHYRRSD